MAAPRNVASASCPPPTSTSPAPSRRSASSATPAVWTDNAPAKVVHGISNLRAEQTDPAALGGFVRGHWTIENSVHYVRDVTYREDAARARTGNAPAVLAAIRNIVTTAYDWPEQSTSPPHDAPPP
jgi:hypothetical protein